MAAGGRLALAAAAAALGARGGEWKVKGGAAGGSGDGLAAEGSDPGVEGPDATPAAREMEGWALCVCWGGSREEAAGATSCALTAEGDADEGREPAACMAGPGAGAVALLAASVLHGMAWHGEDQAWRGRSGVLLLPPGQCVCMHVRLTSSPLRGDSLKRLRPSITQLQNAADLNQSLAAEIAAFSKEVGQPQIVVWA